MSSITPAQLQWRCFHIAEAGFNPGDVIKRGRWGRIVINAGDAHTHYEREMLLERVRAEHYPAKVSRLDCVFAWPDFEQADEWHAKTWPERKDRMYEVVPAEPNPRYHCASWAYLSATDSLSAEEAAHKYWSGFIAKGRPGELLLGCDVVVLRDCAALLDPMYLHTLFQP